MNVSDNPFEQAASAESISIVDRDDNFLGSEERHRARQKGLIHRIVRVLIKNSAGNILIQRRGENLMDHPGKWEWSASGHVQAGEDYGPAAAREAREEIGVTAPLTFLGKFYYEEDLDNGLTLKRYNGVFLGLSDETLDLDPNEVSETRCVSPAELTAWIASRPSDFTDNALAGFNKFLSSIIDTKP